MKYLFLALAIALSLGGVGTYLSFPDATSPLPVVYWSTGPNPTREDTRKHFHEWLIKHGHGEQYTLSTMSELQRFRDRGWTDEQRRAITAGNEAGEKIWSAETSSAELPLTVRVPAFELRIDISAGGTRKRMSQGVSGVASTILPPYAPNIHYLQEIGMMADVTEDARRLGFTLDKTYEALAPIMFVDGRQYTFPSNVTSLSYMVNLSVFEKAGMDPPPKRWTIEDFERIGKELVAKANDGPRQEVFLADKMPPFFFRVFGVSAFNETMTRCTLDQPEVVRSLELQYKWTHVDHLLPTAAEVSSFEVEGGMMGGKFQLLHDGNLAMFNVGRWALMELRRMGDVPLGFAEPPHAGFPCSLLTGHTLGIYEASPHKELGVLLLAYLASDEYSQRVIDVADSLPPRPGVVEFENFKHPASYPNEWTARGSIHVDFANDARENGITWTISPFVPIDKLHREIWSMRGAVLNGVRTPAQAAARAQQRVEREVQRSLEESPKLREEYEQMLAIQTKIERYRAEGRPVPAKWITNPFHLERYRRNGWLEDDSNDAVASNAEIGD